MRTIESDTWRIEYFDEQVFVKESQLIKMTREAGSTEQWVKVYGETEDYLLAKYTIGTSEEVTIDVSDYIRYRQRLGYTTGLILIESESESDFYTLTFDVAGLIDPRKLVIPYSNVEGVLMPLPYKILAPISGVTNRLPMYQDADTYGIVYVDTYRVTGLSSTIEVDGFGYIPISETITRLNMRNVDGDNWRRVEPLRCDAQYVAVRWQTLSGELVTATMELQGLKDVAEMVVSFATFGGGYKGVRNRTQTAVLVMRDLVPYDVWYYGGIVMSNEVQVSLDGVNWMDVQVTDNGVEYADGQAATELKINVKLQNYGAATL